MPRRALRGDTSAEHAETMTSTSEQNLSLDLRAAPSFLLGDVTVRPFSGASITIAHVEFCAGTKFPAHSHPHEQMTVIESGRLRLFVDGHEPFEVGPGELAYVPSHVEHSLVLVRGSRRHRFLRCL